MTQTFTSCSDVEKVLIQLLKKAAVHDPTAMPVAESIPTEAITGFDSLSMLEVLTEFEEETGLHFDEAGFFSTQDPKKYLAVHDIAEKIFLSQPK